MCAGRYFDERANGDNPAMPAWGALTDQQRQRPLAAVGGVIVAFVTAATVGGWALLTQAPQGEGRAATTQARTGTAASPSVAVSETGRATAVRSMPPAAGTAPAGPVEAVDAPWGEFPWPASALPATPPVTVYVVETEERAAVLRAAHAADANTIASINGAPPRISIVVAVGAGGDAIARGALGRTVEDGAPDPPNVQIIDLRGR